MSPTAIDKSEGGPRGVGLLWVILGLRCLMLLGVLTGNRPSGGLLWGGVAREREREGVCGLLWGGGAVGVVEGAIKWGKSGAGGALISYV